MTNTATTTIREWEHLGIGREGVDAATARRLHRLAERTARRLKSPVLTHTTRPSLQAGQVVGVLNVPGATLEMLPKVDGEDAAVRKALVRMLASAWGVRVADGDSALLGSSARICSKC